ncbi:MAG: histidine triad nucleotide-binding protein [Kistimonas sp.]|nr:histidine triad nucleotide-binding protein [Kistimonas sp.]
MDECIFCRIKRGDLPATVVHEDDHCLAFHDKFPRAPTHLLVIPKKHLPDLNALGEEDKALVSHIMLTIPSIARKQGLEAYRMATNIGAAAGQAVFHLHFHILGGGPLSPL